jgi:hypothetical protein
MSTTLKPKIFAIVLASLFLFEALAQELGGQAPARDSGRAGSDTEPNDKYELADPVSDGDVIEGSLLINPQGDIQDWYSIDVPYGKILSASLYLEDYNDSDPGQYNFQLILANLDSSYTMNRWEHVIGVQYWDGNPATMYIQVLINYTDNPFTVHTLPSKYQLTVWISDPLIYSGTAASGNLTLDGVHGKDMYRLDMPPGDDQLLRARLQCPPGGVFSLSLYNVWPTDRGLWLRNASWANLPGGEQQVVVNGLGGPWYMMLGAVAGSGQYSLSTEYAGQAMDSDNFPAGATLVRDLYPHTAFVDQGVDWIDWWVVNAKAGKVIKEARLTPVNGMFESGSAYYLGAYDKDINWLKGDWMPQQSGAYFASVPDIVVGYDGPVYFSVRALYGPGGGANFIPGHGWYKLTFQLPNDPPVYAGGIPDIHMLEDTTDSSLNLSGYFSDPDNDTLSFSVIGSSFNTRPKVNATTGAVTFSPAPDWNGQERVRFQVTDDGPGNLHIEVNTTVYVDPVNDPPVLRGTLDDVFVSEEVEAHTADISGLFSDIDDPATSLIYGIRVVSQDTHPPGGKLTLSYDGLRHIFRMGPARSLFGTFTLEVNCTDGHPGTVHVATRFNLTVTHRNHDPSLVPGTPDPTIIELMEHQNNSQSFLPDLFTDPDMAADYANDTLTYAVSGMRRIVANITADGRLVVDAGTEQYYPGSPYDEKLLVTARDHFGRTATLNITVRVTPIDDPPYLVDFQPDSLAITMNEGARETFRITAADNDTADLTYTWYLDGALDRPKGTPAYTFLPDYTMGGAVHTLRAMVSDGKTNISLEWRIDVTDVNRPPAARISSPANFTKFKTGTPVNLLAEGTDPDGDPLTFIWRDETGVELGRGASIAALNLKPGTHLITLEVNDTHASVKQDVTVIVYKPPAPAAAKGFIPGFTAAVLLAAAALAASLVAIGRKRRDVGTS